MARISMIGLGKLGATMAACLASKGHEVVGVDVNARVVEAIREGHAPVVEPGLADLIAAHRARLRATFDTAEAVHASDITFIVVPSPSDEHGGFSLQYVQRAGRAVGRALARKAGHHVVVLRSTVLPGATEFGLRPILEVESGKRVGVDLGLCYNPEFHAIGSIIRDFLRPEFVIIGESDPAAGEALAALYRSVLDNEPPVVRTSFVNAELAKIAVNTFVTMKIAFANMLADLCEQLPGGDVDAVTQAVGLDPRIGRRYLSGGLAYGGPCFPRDNLALSFLARQLGVQDGLPESTEGHNRRRGRDLAERIAAQLAPRTKVAILGVAFKPGTTIVEVSPGLELARELAARGHEPIVYDPLALDAARLELGDTCDYADALPACLAAAEAVVVANPDPAFKALRAVDFPMREQPIIVFDCWRILRGALSGQPHLRYVPLGLGACDSALAARLEALWAAGSPVALTSA